MKKILQLFLTCFAFMYWQDANATTCAGAQAGVLGSNTLVCSGTNDISGISGCGSTSYQGGEEALLTFTPATTGNMALDYTGVSYTGIFVWDDCPTAGGTCVGTPITTTGNTNTMNVSVTAGVTYYIMVDTWPSPDAPCPGTLNIAVGAPLVPPVNDDISGALPLTLGAGACATPVTGSNVVASNSGVAHSCANYSGGDVWFYAIVPAGGSLSVEGTNVDFTDGGMQAYSGPSNALVSINCDDDDSPAGAMPAIYPADGLTGLTPGDTIWFAFWEYGNDAFGDFEICAWGPPTCPEPTAASSSVVSSTEVDLDWTTGGASDWIVEYGPAGFAQGSGTIEIVTGNDSLNITGLTPSTTYDWYVRDTCGAGDNSLWVGVNSFTTLATCPEPTALGSSLNSTTEVDLDWTTGGASDWIVEYGPAGFAQGSGIIEIVTGNDSLNITGLTAETSYDWYVRDSCGAGDNSVWVGPNTFFTGYCTPNPSNVDGSGITNVTMGTINNTTGTEAGNYGDFSAQITDAAQSTTFNIDVTFETGYTYNTFVWVDWNDNLDFSDAGEAFYLGEASSANPTTLSGSISIPLTASLGNHRIRIGSADGGLGSTLPSNPCYTGSYASFEDYTLNVVAPPPCVQPTLDSVSNVLQTSADLYWTTGGSANWDIEWGVAGFTQGSGTLISNTASNPYSLTGLSVATAYDFYVRDNCAPDSSAWSGPISFTTLCPVAFAAPFCEGFEGGSIGCWGNETVADQLDWTLNSGSTISSNTGPSAANGGSQYIYTETSGSSNGDTAILYSPAIDLTALTTPAIDFYYHMYGAGMDADGTFAVDVSTDGTTWVNVFTKMGNQGNQWNNGYVEMPTYAGDTVVFRFSGIVSTTGTTYENDFAIDDFCVIEALACPGAPSDLSVSNVTFISADLHWANNFSATNWVVEWDTTGFVQGTGNDFGVANDTFTTITGLTANTDYEFYVRDDCGSGDSSNWAGPFPFFTGYCTPNPFNVDGSGIVNVTMGSINNTTVAEPGNYGDYSAMVTDAGQGVDFDIDISLNTGFGYTYFLWAFVDWNNDLDFDDADEQIYLGESTNTSTTTYNASITIPATASLGNHLIRLAGSDVGLGSVAPSDPCYTGSYATFEDYTLNVITCNIPVTAVDTSICDGDSIVLSNGNSVLTAGMYNDTLSATSGCDSVVTYNVAVLMPSTSTVDTVVCQGTPLTLPGGTMVSSGGSYDEVYTNAVGCDSTVTYNVTMNVATASAQDVQLCDGATFTLPLSGTVVSVANSYVETTTNAVGCDSVITYNVTTGMSTAETLDVSFCTGDSVMLADGSYASAAGTMMVTSTNASGCDHVTTYNITENMVGTGTMAESICSGSSYMFDGQALTTAGVYTMMVTTANGCDSTVELTLSILPVSSSTTNAAICEGASYMWDGAAVTIAGTYELTTPSANGCDSVATLNLVVNPTSNSTMMATICEGDSYMFDGNSLTTAGTYTSNGTTTNGCDSVVVLTLTVDAAADVTTTASICKGDVYTLGTQSLTTAGTYTETMTNANGCSYTETLTLSVNNAVSTSEEVLLCGDQLTYTLANGTVVDEAGTYTATVAASNACDSTITYNVSTCVGIFTVENNVAIVAYPNPAKDKLNVQFEERLTNNNEISIVNVLGQRVYNKTNFDELLLEVNTSEFTNGVYYINVTSDNKTSVVPFTVAK